MERQTPTKAMEMVDATLAKNDVASTADAEDAAGGGGSGDETVLAAGDGSGGQSGRDRVKGPWSPEEDAILSRLVSKFGARNWSLIARGIAGRSGKSCRLRWCNQLDPAVKRKPFSGIIPFYLSKHLPFHLNFSFLFQEKFEVILECDCFVDYYFFFYFFRLKIIDFIEFLFLVDIKNSQCDCH